MNLKKYPYFLSNGYVVLLISVIGLFAVFGSEDSSNYPRWVIEFSILMSETFPPIAGYSSRSDFPLVTRVYMSAAFLLLPIHFIFTYRELVDSVDQKWYRHLWILNSWLEFFKRLVLTLVMMLIVLVTLILNPGYDFNLIPINSSRLMLGLLGWVFAGGISGVLAAWIVCALAAMHRYLKGL